ncbi:MAG: hypothetical protein K5897_11020 [Eubacterium sp.]|nr:hypothetical protein [Eubacterium sp.]
MELDFEYTSDCVLKKLVLVPGKDEDPDTLYALSRELLVENPAIPFTRKAKSGKFNDLTDDDYTEILNRTKLLGNYVFEKKTNLNIFQLAVSLLKIIMDPEMVELKDKAMVLTSPPPAK